mmetsp:Transcript_32651/g.52097  ORF Transcript_32651/g.52097 Transcript_32651/m.52097 type:complete len:906 (-) Transcript_32651:71-2788(-)
MGDERIYELERRISHLEAEIEEKDDELELAARLGQALVRKETQTAEELINFKMQYRRKEEELLTTMQENADLVEANHSLRKKYETQRRDSLVSESESHAAHSDTIKKLEDKIQELEEANARLQYDLKRTRLALQSPRRSSNNEEALQDRINEQEKELARLRDLAADNEKLSASSVQILDAQRVIAELKASHDREIEILKRTSEEQLRTYQQVSQNENKKLMSYMEQQMGTFRKQFETKLQHDEAMREDLNDCKELISGSFRNRSNLSDSLTEENSGLLDEFEDEPSVENDELRLKLFEAEQKEKAVGEKLQNLEHKCQSMGSQYTSICTYDICTECRRVENAPVPPAIEEEEGFKSPPRSFNSHFTAETRSSRRDLKGASFASKFSTETLDLDLDFENTTCPEERTAVPEHESADTRDESEAKTMNNENEPENSQERATESMKKRSPPPLKIITSTSAAEEEKGMSLRDMLAMTPPSEKEEGDREGKDMSLRDMLAMTPPAKKKIEGDDDGVSLRDILMMSPPARSCEEESDIVSATSSDANQTKKVSGILRSKGLAFFRSSENKGQQPEVSYPEFGAAWDTAMKGTLQICQSSRNQKSERWVSRYCVFVNRMFFVFRTEADAQRYSAPTMEDTSSTSSTKKRVKPEIVIHLDASELRVVRRPIANDKDEADPRSSMLAWLKKRNPGNTTDLRGTSSSGKRLFKLQLAEQLMEEDFLPCFEEAMHQQDYRFSGASESISGRSVSFSSADDSSILTAGSHLSTTHKSSISQQVMIAFYTEAERTKWADAFVEGTKIPKLISGSIWIKRNRVKKDEEWVKRYAVARTGKLELYDTASDVVRETVSLSAVKVEPAYSSHIFISHRQHHKQLVTLRALDGTERNWWIGALRACGPQKKSTLSEANTQAA